MKVIGAVTTAVLLCIFAAVTMDIYAQAVTQKKRNAQTKVVEMVVVSQRAASQAQGAKSGRFTMNSRSSATPARLVYQIVYQVVLSFRQ